MITLRTTATAFLMNRDDFLVMKRSPDRKLAPGLWAGVGGHLEPEEVNDPRKACLREVFEETGIRESDIEGLRLKYVILRRRKNEVRVNYIYFGCTRVREVIDTPEGELYWIDKCELLNREFTATIRIMLKHYFDQGKDMDDVLVGTAGADDSRPVIRWSPMQDWES